MSVKYRFHHLSAFILDAILNISICSMMTEWHHLDSSKARSDIRESAKKKTLDANSRSSQISAFFCRTKPCLSRFLAHRSRRLGGELIGYPWIQRPSLHRRRRLSVHIFKHLLLRNRLANQAKFYVEPPWEGGTEVYINGPGHMTKMAATPIYNKNPSIIFFRTDGPIFTKIGM